MRVLVTGASGFVGSNLVWTLRNIALGNDHRDWLAPLRDVEVLELDKGNAGELRYLASKADFVVHLAGVNRADDPAELCNGNRALAEELVEALEASGSSCPVIFASSVQASLEGRFSGSPYGQGKLEAEDVLRAYGRRAGAKVLVFRLPNVYGKWCRPNYNSVVATFCFNAARGMPLRVDDPSVDLALLYVDDLVEDLLRAIMGRALPGEDGLCRVTTVDHATVGELAGIIGAFAEEQGGSLVPHRTPHSLEEKLRATFESYLPSSSVSYALDSHIDDRGSFAEFVRTTGSGQVSVNVCRPGQTKGNHWHHSKWEKFLIVAGEGLIRMREVPHGGASPQPATELRVSADEFRVVEMLPGWVHSIANTSSEQDLVFVIWASEAFDPSQPDTFAMEV